MLLTQDIPTKKPARVRKPDLGPPPPPKPKGLINTEKAHQLALMEELIQIKKDRATQYEKIKPMLFNLGLVIAMILVVGAFEWRSYGGDELVDLGGVQENMDEILDIPITEQPPPPPPSKKIVQPKITVVEDVEELIEDIELDFDIEMTEQTVVEQVEQTILEVEEVEEEIDEVFTVVESYPEPKGGMQAFLKYLYENIEYPKKALRARVDGKVFVQFVVDKDGTLTNLEVIKGVGMGCDEEAIRVLKASPKWNPGKQRGRAVKVKRVLPIIFKYKERKR